MKKISWFILFFFEFSAAFGQTSNSSQNYVYCYNDSLINYKSLEVKLTPIGTPYFQVDDSKIQLDNVKFFKDFSGLYANTQNINWHYLPVFALQICHDKVDVYQDGQIITN